MYLHHCLYFSLCSHVYLDYSWEYGLISVSDVVFVVFVKFMRTHQYVCIRCDIRHFNRILKST